MTPMLFPIILKTEETEYAQILEKRKTENESVVLIERNRPQVGTSITVYSSKNSGNEQEK